MIEIINDIKKGKYTKYIIIIIIFATYAMAFTSVVYNNDGVNYLPFKGERTSNGIINGRFSLIPLQAILYADHTLYTLNLVIGIIALLMAGKYILKIFNINKEYQKILIYTTILTYPIITFFLGYVSHFSMYWISMAAIIIGLYNILKNDNKGNIIGVVLIIFSLSLYQVFISILLSLFILYYLIENSENEINFIEMSKKFSWILLAIIIYYFIQESLSIINGIENNRFNLFQTIINLPINILATYKFFILFLFGQLKYFNFHRGSEIINIVGLITYIYVFLIQGKNKFKSFILLLLFIPAMYTIYIIISSTPIKYYYINFGVLVFFIGFIIISDKIINKKILSIIIVLLSIMVYNNIVFFNASTVQEVNITKNTERFISKVTFDLAAMDGYTKDSKVYFKGTINKNDNFDFNREGIFTIPKANRILPVALSGFKNQSDRINSLMRYYGMKLNYISDYETILINEQKFSDAPSFPKPGYIYKDDGVFIVKIGENRN